MIAAFSFGEAAWAEETKKTEMDGVETSPYIEAIEAIPGDEFSRIRTIRTYKADRGNTMLVSSVPFVVPWSWGEGELKAFCRPEFKVSEGEVLETTKDWWEEIGRTNHPCIPLGSKIMVNRKISTVRADRGIITTVTSWRQPVRGGCTFIIPSDGSGERFAAFKTGPGENAALICGETTGLGGVVAVDDGAGGAESRWKLIPGKEISVQFYRVQ